MSGKGHLVSGPVFMADMCLCYYCISHLDISAVFIPDILDGFKKLFFYYEFSDRIFIQSLFIGLSILFYGVGLLIPDIDSPNSTISSFLHFHIPIAHRGLTHTLYVVGLIAYVGIMWFKPLIYLALGVLVHDLFDKPSKAGWVPFYPIGRYYISNNIVISKNKKIALYKTGDDSEFIFLVIFVVLSLVFAGFVYYFFVM